MRALVLILSLAGLALQAVPPQGPAHGPYYGQNVICYRGETVLNAQPKGRVHCACVSPCDVDDQGNARGEDRSCQTYCGRGEQCLCHVDECDGRH